MARGLPTREEVSGSEVRREEDELEASSFSLNWWWLKVW